MMTFFGSRQRRTRAAEASKGRLRGDRLLQHQDGAAAVLAQGRPACKKAIVQPKQPAREAALPRLGYEKVEGHERNRHELALKVAEPGEDGSARLPVALREGVLVRRAGGGRHRPAQSQQWVVPEGLEEDSAPSGPQQTADLRERSFEVEMVEDRDADDEVERRVGEPRLVRVCHLEANVRGAGRGSTGASLVDLPLGDVDTDDLTRAALEESKGEEAVATPVVEHGLSARVIEVVDVARTVECTQGAIDHSSHPQELALLVPELLLPKKDGRVACGLGQGPPILAALRAH
jgi:hypothetical protein